MSYDDDVLRVVFELWEDGATWREIAARYGWKRGKTKHAIRAAKRLHRADTADAGDHDVTPAPTSATDTAVYAGLRAGARFSVPSFEYTGTLPTGTVPRFTGAWALTGDFMVINDVHIPATNWSFADVMLSVATAHLSRPRRLIIAGDLINGDALSRWDDIVLCTPLADELTHAEKFLNHLARWFDAIYLTRGNHENRLLFGMKGQLHAPHFRRMLTDNSRVQFSIYSWLTVVSGGIEWRITHQRNYSRNPLTVARKLATKHKANIISAHQHHSATGRDDSNTHTVIDSGGLHDSELMAYVNLDDTTSPVMCNGFVLLRDGVGTLFTPEEYAMTDWDMWLGGTAVEARAA